MCTYLMSWKFFKKLTESKKQVIISYCLFKLKFVMSATLKHDITITEGDVVFNEAYYEYFHKLKSLNLDGFKLVRISGDFNDDYMDGDERILIVLEAI